MPESRFVSQTSVRCEDCEVRGDLKNEGSPRRDVEGRILLSIRQCSGCGSEAGQRRGSGSIAVKRPDPYAGHIDLTDPYVKRRYERAKSRSLKRAPRHARRRYLELARIEALMSELPT